MLNEQYPSKWKSILGPTALAVTAVPVGGPGQSIFFECLSGNIWINPLATAVAGTTAHKMTAGSYRTLSLESALSIISDVTGATYQYVILKY